MELPALNVSSTSAIFINEKGNRNVSHNYGNLKIHWIPKMKEARHDRELWRNVFSGPNQQEPYLHSKVPKPDRLSGRRDLIKNQTLYSCVEECTTRELCGSDRWLGAEDGTWKSCCNCWITWNGTSVALSSSVNFTHFEIILYNKKRFTNVIHYFIYIFALKLKPWRSL